MRNSKLNSKSLKKKSLFFISFCCFFSVFIAGCNKSSSIKSINEEERFSLNYGNFEEQISIEDLNHVGNIRLGVAMRDGFFYILDGSSKKIMELNSFGDILSLFYNEESVTSELINKKKNSEEHNYREITFPFDYPGQIALDSNKCIYTVCTIPRNRQEQGDDGILYSQAVLCITRDGSNIDYIGQQGPGGTPFPYIKNIYTTEKDELVVVSNSLDGLIVYWFASNGFLKYMIPISSNNIPKMEPVGDDIEQYQNLDNVIPDLNEYKLYVKVDYYSTSIDEESKVQKGINYDTTYLYEFDCETGVYSSPLVIPPYEESVVVDYSKLTYKIPYDFLGVTKSGWKFFIIKTADGFNIEMVQNESQKIIERNFKMDSNENLFYTMDLSHEGIITVLYLDKDKAHTVWYRTDTLIDSILKN